MQSILHYMCITLKPVDGACMYFGHSIVAELLGSGTWHVMNVEA